MSEQSLVEKRLTNRVQEIDITLKKAVRNPELEESKELIKEANKVCKEIMIEDDLDNIKELMKANSSVIEYFQEEIDGIIFIGRRELPKGPKRDHQDVEWFFRGFCTYEEFSNFEEIYVKFQDKFGKYNFWDDEDYDLYLEVCGGVVGNELLIDYPIKKYWDQKRVLVSPFGVGVDGGLSNGGNAQWGNYEKFKAEVEEIKEQGGPKSIEDRIKLRINDDFDSIWLGEYNQLYKE
ncbi:hypothetical protein BX659_12629 [Orenia metallireducens]|uniref:Uncharacterized protein n=1 Tax=Orenia metallireducens TaxID=1413210 RepID=A0A285I2K0_9FIRM|nr:hypothetical protein [Orenia metallireducens]PRX23250.1 hypothetical protein BX659_12629 [Orenia metallireducens]SNY42097.1 hypothetical protein SAMN06265827_12929 [Orenia metallireducens]